MTVTSSAADRPVAPGVPAGGTARILVRGTSWSALAQLVPVVTSIVLTPFLIRHLTLAGFGLYVLANTIVSFLRQFDGGLGGTALRFFSLQAGRNDRAATTRLLTTLVTLVLVAGGLVATAVIFLASPLLSAFNVGGTLLASGVVLLRTLAVLVIVGIWSGLFTSVLVARQRFAFISVTGAANSVVGTVLLVVLLDTGHGLRAVALVMALQSVTSTTVLAAGASRWLDRHAVSLVSRVELREFFHFASRVQLVGLGSLLTLEADNVVVGAVRGASSVGTFSVGANFALQLRQVVINGLGPITSQLGRAYGARGHAARAEFESLQRAWVVLTTGWCIAGVGSSYVAMTAWLGHGYGTTGIVAVLLSVSNMVNLWTGVTTAWLQTTGYPGVEARYATVGIVFNVGLVAVLAVPFGLYGIAAATATAQVIASLYLLRLTATKVAEPVKSFLRDVPVVSGLLSGAVTVVLEFSLRSLLPFGPFGLVCAGALTIPGLVVFLARERWLVNALRSAL